MLYISIIFDICYAFIFSAFWFSFSFFFEVHFIFICCRFGLYFLSLMNSFPLHFVSLCYFFCVHFKQSFYSATQNIAWFSVSRAANVVNGQLINHQQPSIPCTHLIPLGLQVRINWYFAPMHHLIQ